MDSLTNWDKDAGTNDLDTDLETKLNEIITKINEIVTWINSQ